MMILAGAAAGGGACADSAAGRSARTRQRNLLFIKVTLAGEESKDPHLRKARRCGALSIRSLRDKPPKIMASLATLKAISTRRLGEHQPRGPTQDRKSVV